MITTKHCSLFFACDSVPRKRIASNSVGFYVDIGFSWRICRYKLQLSRWPLLCFIVLYMIVITSDLKNFFCSKSYIQSYRRNSDIVGWGGWKSFSSSKRGCNYIFFVLSTKSRIANFYFNHHETHNSNGLLLIAPGDNIWLSLVCGQWTRAASMKL